MLGVHVVRHDNLHLYHDEMEQCFRGRYQVCVRERGWTELERSDGRETDQFDTEDAVHLLAIDGRQVIGGIRLNPTTGPTLLSEVFPYLSSGPLIRSPDVYDKTRLWVAKQRRGGPRPSVEAYLMAGCVEFALALGLSKILSICEPWRVARNEKLGWTLRLLGPPHDINGVPCVAIEKYVSETVWIGMCLKESLPGSVLIWKGTARPSYRLPELIPAVA
jgi:acyl-homoserine lactone synthase